MSHAQTITPRQGPDFGFDGDLPRFWLGDDPFRSRFFDAMSMLFPEGEKFFIACVRDFRDGIADPALAAQVKDFMYQEGQHGMVHGRFNQRLKDHGVAVDKILERQQRILFAIYRKRLPAIYTLGMTAAAEHLTAMMCHGFFRSDLMQDADPRVRAMYAWHAVEEIEHKAVAFDVFQKVARGGYFTRILAMLHVSVTFALHTLVVLRHMLKVDGRNTWGTWLKGLWWLYGPRGMFTRVLPHYLLYFLPGFHPWRFGNMDSYRVWTETFAHTGGDAIAAGTAVATEFAERDARAAA